MSLHRAVFACLCCAWTVASLGSSQTGNALSSDVSDESTVLLQLESKRDQAGDWMRKREIAVPTELYVDLDTAPRLRWRNVTRYYQQMGVFPEGLLFHMEPDYYGIKALIKTMHIDPEYLEEMEGVVADVNDPRVTVEQLIYINLLYELKGPTESDAGAWIAPWHHPEAASANLSGCSGLLAAMPDGTVVHGRNMDWDGFKITVNGTTLLYPHVTVEVTFLKAGKPFITSVQWPGGFGIHTGMRYDGWSLQQNTRFASVEPNIIAGLTAGGQGFNFLVRQIMETTPDFEAAVDKLYNANFMAPQYFIMAGPRPYQGAVITIDRAGNHVEGTPPIQRLAQDLPTTKGGHVHRRWYLYQPNDDKGGLPTDPRRLIEEARLLVSSQQSVGIDWVFNELSVPPVFDLLTIFTTVYIPATGYKRTKVFLNSLR